MNPTLIFILILGTAIGLALVGLALRMMRAEKEKEKEKEIGIEKEKEPPHTHAKRPATQFDPPMLELARLLRAPDGTFIVEADGRRYGHRLDITDANVGRRLLDALDEFQKFLRTDQPRPASPLASSAAPAPAPPPPNPPPPPPPNK
ncbi:MAG: hypothetical protein AAB427_04060, partial [Chloroflexota bacterium]